MPTNTYVALATQTLSSAASTVTFSSIPSGYTDLVLQCSLRADTSTYNNMNYPLLRFNGDSTSGLYSVTNLYARNTGGGDTANSSRSSSQNEINSGGIATSAMTSGIFSTYQIQLQNYASTSVFKTVLARIGTGGNLTASDGTWASVGLWRNTNAITSLSLTATSSGSFQIGSTFSLYGIKAANASVVKATGGTISFDTSGNVIHTFTSSGTFTPTQSLTADYLVVAGGGGSGGGNTTPGGGGGAGGLRSTVTATGGGGSLETPLSLTATGYTVTIGAGGTGDSSGGGGSTAGANSVFSTITSAGGGKGSNGLGGNGGSGGGTGNGGGFGSGTANQGYNGGAMFDSSFVRTAGGGGGAGAAGVSGTNPNAGNGGAGVAVAITGTSVTYAGGGGGGAANQAGGGGSTGGAGGGGNGGVGGSGVAGTINTGGGAGGSGNWFGATAGLQGGSGIVIIRYAG
jgi:hypothetical protein